MINGKHELNMERSTLERKQTKKGVHTRHQQPVGYEDKHENTTESFQVRVSI